MQRDSRRIFSTPEYLTRFSPVLLIRLAHLFPDDFELVISSGQIPPESAADTLRLADLVPILTSSGISNDLADALFLINAFASQRNRRILEEEVKHTTPELNVNLPPDISDADYALSVWLARPESSVLEAALSRVTLMSRRAFHYFCPRDLSMASRAPVVHPERLTRLVSQLRGGLKTSGRSRGLAVIPFLDDANEDWFLIRRSTLPDRITYFDDSEEEVSLSVILRAYDVVVFDRTTGMLKVNSRDRLHELYRQAFSDFYFGDLTFFVKRDIFNLDPLRSSSLSAVSTEGAAGVSHVDLFSVCYTVMDNFLPKQFVVSRRNWYATTTGDEAPVPTDADKINYATFEVKYPYHKVPRRCRVDAGNVLSYSRDDEAKAFESFLVARGFARGMETLIRDSAA